MDQFMKKNTHIYKNQEKNEISTYNGTSPLIFVFDEASSMLKIQSKNKETNFEQVHAANYT
ncbi:hypothetical protein BpHYR1_041286 [Brachionus plicatilis]|uniref:Uncharacterized protein n=1 Tax=Brachionus plicatilis TaxID=10195 RepID=A0A3M7QET5_BRAPC|nr:hypothetical protein BpHYR1_041286 [Brachionus plicatilis]